MELSQELRLYLMALALRDTPALAVVLFESLLFVQPLALKEWILYISSWNFKKTSWFFGGDFFLWRYPSSRKHVNLLDLSWWEVTSKRSVKSSLFIRKQINHYPPACIVKHVKLNLDDYHATSIDVLNLLVHHGSGYFSQTLGSFREKCHIISETFTPKSVMVKG